MKKYFSKITIVYPIIMAVLLLYIFVHVNYSHHIVNASLKTDLKSDYIDQQLLLIFDKNISYKEQITTIHKITPNSNIIEQDRNYVLIKLPNSISVQTAIKLYKDCKKVIIAEPNYTISAFKLSDDTYSKSQWSLQNTGSYRSYFNNLNKKIYSNKKVDLNVADAWASYNTKNRGKEEVIVAIIDTGIDVNHEDLSSQIWTNKGEIHDDGIDNDGNGYIDDVNGWDFYNNDNSVCHYTYDKSSNSYSTNYNDNDDHGTHCAGIIGAVANNKIGIAGVASNINLKIMPLKIEGGKNGNGSISNAIKAIRYAQQMGAKICNISWGSSAKSSALEQVIKESSMLFITAAGNTGSNNDTSPVYPASYELDNIISVTFITPHGLLTSLSNYGKSSVDIAAPGYDILSTTVGDSYASMSGSSMAVPHITGVAAMLYAYKQNLYPSEVKALLLEHISILPDLKGYVKSPGIPNVSELTNHVSKLQSDLNTPTISCSTVFKSGKIYIKLKTEDTGGSGIRAIKYLYGSHPLSAFNHGATGNSVSSNELSVTKSGFYTLYISDYAGNEQRLQYNVIDDDSAPKIKASYSVSDDYEKITITAKISDDLSGVKQVKYLKGKKSVKDFKPSKAGKIITKKDGSYKFKVSDPGTYTIYAIDYRGNKTVCVVNADIIKSTSLLVTSTLKPLNTGSSFTLQPLIKPANTTDKITYTSMDNSIVSVNSKGVVTARGKGSTSVTIQTSSGIKTSVVIIVF